MSKQFLIILIVLFAIFAGFIVITKNKGDTSDIDTTTGSQNVFGNQESKVEVVEYGDFQCPACRAYYPIIKQVESEYGDRIALRFRHFPLTSIHPNAMAAHRAAEAAANQDAFWEMYDMLYQRQDEWNNSKNASEIFEQYAADLGLDVEKYKTDVISPETAAIINADTSIAGDLGLTGTPSFSINGAVIDRPTDFAGFAELIEAALAKNVEQTSDSEPASETE